MMSKNASADAPTESNDEKLRRMLLGRESNLRTFGLLMYLQAFLFVCYGLVFSLMPFAFLLGLGPEGTATPSPFAFVVFLLLGTAASGFGYWIWRGAGSMRRLSRSGRPAAVVSSILMLGAMPIGTLIGGVALFMLLDERGNFVLSPEYRELQGRTPHIKAKLSPITKFFIGLLIVVLALAFLSMLMVLIVEGPAGFNP